MHCFYITIFLLASHTSLLQVYGCYPYKCYRCYLFQASGYQKRVGIQAKLSLRFLKEPYIITLKYFETFESTHLAYGCTLNKLTDEKTYSFTYFFRGTQREYSSKPLKHSIVERILVFKRQIQAYFYPLKIFHLFGFPS